MHEYTFEDAGIWGQTIKILQMLYVQAVVSWSFTLAQATNASHLKVTSSARLLGRQRGEGRCDSRRVGEELAEWKSSSSAVGPFSHAAASKILMMRMKENKTWRLECRSQCPELKEWGREVRKRGQGSLEHCSNSHSHHPPSDLTPRSCRCKDACVAGFSCQCVLLWWLTPFLHTQPTTNPSRGKMEGCRGGDGERKEGERKEGCYVSKRF